MSSAAIISVEGLSKRYIISHEVRQDTLTDTMSRRVSAAWRKASMRSTRTTEEFWALRHIDFSIGRGEVVGVIGRNGAGKSTLLKLLSRITEPTSGRITLRGRVASLLEVGTGFHPELTGRDNIYLNGAILGMRRAEIRRKFDEIVSFAEVEQFLDTPVKRYSSGMYVRLAFAVAAHLEPEILIVDEVLAVGDQKFQNKCIGKMQSVARDTGRTVLLVSHNLAVVQSICQRCLLLERGVLVRDSTPGETVSHYMEQGTQQRWHREAALSNTCSFIDISARVALDNPRGPSVEIDAVIESNIAKTIALEVFLHDALGQNLGIGALGNVIGTPPISLHLGRQTVRSAFPVSMLANGAYRLSFKLVTPFISAHDEVPYAVAFEVELPPPENAAHRLLQNWGHGSFMLPLERL